MKDFFSHINGIISELFQKEEFWFIVFALGIGGMFLFNLPVISGEEIIFALMLFFKKTWGMWFFLILFPIVKSLWLFVGHELFKQKEEWVVLDILIPREIKKNPRAMEQALALFCAMRSAPDSFKKVYIDRETTRWFSLELVSIGGEIHLYVRTPKRYKDRVEAALFSYYEDNEIKEIEDYLAPFPHTCRTLKESGIEFWGTEMILSKEDAYPIKTYPAFEHEAEERQYDPIAPFLEILGKTKKGECAGAHILIAPASAKWKDEWKELVEKLQKPPTSASEDGMIARTPGQTDTLKAVEENLARPAFHTLIRLFYFSPETTFSKDYGGGIVGNFQQYTALNLNSFKGNSAVAPRASAWSKPYIFPGLRAYHRKERLLHMLVRRDFPPELFLGRVILSSLFSWYTKSKSFVMNTEGIATLFHPPTKVVLSAPHIRQVHSKKTGPPIGLAIYGEEQELERYQ